MVERVPLLTRLWRASVWHRNGVAAEDWRYRGIFRWVLPVSNIYFLWFGAAGWFNGVQTVQNATSANWQTWWSGALAVAAVVALVGVAFPKLWVVEVIGKIPLIALVSVYIAIFAILGLEKPAVAPTAGLINILILLPIWRVGDLGFVWWKRRNR